MKQILALLFGVSYVLGVDVWVTDYVPEDAGKPMNESENLGICYGTNTNWQTYPYMAALRYSSGSACCSASIISLDPPVLLTAAHCNGCLGSVRIGCSNPANCDGDSYPISQFIQNPSYGSPTQFSNDIAVVRLSSAITTSGAQEVELPNTRPSIGSSRATGYGVTQSGSIPTSLQTASLNVIENQLCQDIMSSALGGGTFIDSSMICIRGGTSGQENVPGTCSGDSGGPWTGVSNNQQVGVTSWGLQGSGTGCNSCSCCVGYPSVGADVAHASSWINGYLDAWKAGDFNYTSA